VIVHRLLVFACLPAFVLGQGLLVERSAEGAITFQPAVNLSVNGKDRVLVLGPQPTSSTPVNKLPNTKLGASKLLLDAVSGVVLQFGAGPVQYLYPSGIDKKAAPPPQEAWAESTITFKKSPQDKTPVTSPAPRLIAFLPGGHAELAELCLDDSALALIGGSAGAFPAQLNLIAAAVAAFGSHPALATVEQRVLQLMQERLARFAGGRDSAKSLDEGLRFAELSARAYANEASHTQVRGQLTAAKAWLDKRTAILRTLAAGEQWDAFLLAYNDFEPHQESFPALAAQQRAALKASLDTHWKSGRDRMGRSEFRRAWTEFRTASFRQPSNNELQRDLAVAWSQHSRQTAVDRQQKRKQLTAGELDVIQQTRTIAERYSQQGKLDEALTKIGEAERMDPESLPVLLTKASILGARQEYGKALTTLDTFDLLAIDKEREPGNKLRT
jgi:tetratricopeptide (TPR) repeat protein